MANVGPEYKDNMFYVLRSFVMLSLDEKLSETLFWYCSTEKANFWNIEDAILWRIVCIIYTTNDWRPLSRKRKSADPICN